MKASVLIAAYKAGPFLAPALESVRRQTHADWELIVVEDGSRDETQTLVEAFARSVRQPVRYDNLGSNQGVASARNRLLDLATGDVQLFIDADDVWMPDHIAHAVTAIGAGAALAVSDVVTFDLTSGKDLETITPPRSLEADPVPTLFRGSVIYTSSAVALSRTAVERAGRFDRTLRIGEDRDYWLRVALSGGRLVCTGHRSCRYAKHASSTMAKTLLVAEQTVRFYEKYADLAAVPSVFRRQQRIESLVNYGKLLRRADPRESARSFAAAWRLKPASLVITLHWGWSTALGLLRRG